MTEQMPAKDRVLNAERVLTTAHRNADRNPSTRIGGSGVRRRLVRNGDALGRIDVTPAAREFEVWLVPGCSASPSQREQSFASVLVDLRLFLDLLPRA